MVVFWGVDELLRDIVILVYACMMGQLMMEVVCSPRLFMYSCWRGSLYPRLLRVDPLTAEMRFPFPGLPRDVTSQQQ